MITSIASLYNSKEVLELFAASPAHQDYTEVDLQNVIMPALILRQAFLYWDEGKLVGFASLAFMSEELSDAFAKRQHRLTPADWVSGKEPWIVDLITPDHRGKEICAHIEQYLLSQGYDHVHSIREKGDRHVRLSLRKRPA